MEKVYLGLTILFLIGTIIAFWQKFYGFGIIGVVLTILFARFWQIARESKKALKEHDLLRSYNI